MINAIIAVDSEFGFSKEQTIPWTIKEDMKKFKCLTINGIVIMGKNTWKSLEKPLSNRINIIISSVQEENYENVIFCSSIQESIEISLIKYFSKEVDKIFIIGGNSLYEYILNSVLLDKFYVTNIRKNYECDIFLNKELLHEKCNKIDEVSIITQDHEVSFCVYENKRRYSGEQQYLDLMLQTLLNGEFRSTRNANTWSLFSNQIKFNLGKGFPLTTTRKSFFKNIFYELKMFLLGESNTKEYLEKYGVNIWRQNTSREFLDSVGLTENQEGDIGYLYGVLWRHFKSENGEIDQLENVINLLRQDPHSRRIIMTSYDPKGVNLGPLYPCHSIVLQFYVEKENKLSIHMYQRSADLFLGLNTNIPSTALLCHIICEICGFSPGTITISLGDYHIYENHFNSVIKQLSRNPLKYPKLIIQNFSTIECMKIEDIIIEDYQYYPSIKTEMIA